MWQGRAIALMSAVLPALISQRNARSMYLTRHTLKESLTLSGLEALAEEIEKSTLTLANPIRSHLATVPGYPRVELREMSNEKHEYVRMQWLPILD